MTRWSLFLQTLSLLHHFLGLYSSDVAFEAADDLGLCHPLPGARGILKKCVTGQAVYPLSEQDGLKAQERRYTAYGKEKH